MSVKMYDGNDKVFLAACEKADTRPTRRQWKKWLQKRGKAYRASVERTA